MNGISMEWDSDDTDAYFVGEHNHPIITGPLFVYNGRSIMDRASETRFLVCATPISNTYGFDSGRAYWVLAVDHPKVSPEEREQLHQTCIDLTRMRLAAAGIDV